jgi:hypothetical protein
MLSVLTVVPVEANPQAIIYAPLSKLGMWRIIPRFWVYSALIMRRIAIVWPQTACALWGGIYPGFGVATSALASHEFNSITQRRTLLPTNLVGSQIWYYLPKH